MSMFDKVLKKGKSNPKLDRAEQDNLFADIALSKDYRVDPAVMYEALRRWKDFLYKKALEKGFDPSVNDKRKVQFKEFIDPTGRDCTLLYSEWKQKTNGGFSPGAMVGFRDNISIKNRAFVFLLSAKSIATQPKIERNVNDIVLALTGGVAALYGSSPIHLDQFKKEVDFSMKNDPFFHSNPDTKRLIEKGFSEAKDMLSFERPLQDDARFAWASQRSSMFIPNFDNPNNPLISASAESIFNSEGVLINGEFEYLKQNPVDYLPHSGGPPI